MSSLSAEDVEHTHSGVTTVPSLVATTSVGTSRFRLVGPPVGSERYSSIGIAAKRALDVTASLFLLVVLSPVLLAIAIAIRVDSKGSPLFSQTRVGFKEQPFTIWKFRTMAANNDDSEHRQFVTSMLRGEAEGEPDPVSSGPVFKLIGDPRVTRLGARLRRTSLDELPQLINVLNGTMSLVGPRPCLTYELEEFTPEQRKRFASMPGMTGLWQVEGRNSMHPAEALELDLRYVDTCSTLTDLRILVKTVGVVAKGSGY